MKLANTSALLLVVGWCGTYIHSQTNPSAPSSATASAASKSNAATVPAESQLIQTAIQSQGEVKQEAIHKLGVLRSKDSVDALADIMRKAPDVESRSNSAAALGKIGGQRSTSELVNAMKGDPSIAVRVQAARGLGMGQTPEATKQLIEGTHAQNPIELRAESVRSLGQAHTPQARQSIIDATKDPNAEVRLAAVDAIAQEHDSSVMNAAVFLARDPDPRVAAQAATSLGDLRVKQAQSFLTENLLQSPVTNVRAQSAFALGRIGEPNAVNVLAETIFKKTEQFEVKLASVEALGLIPGAKSAATLTQVLNTTDDKKLQQAAALIACQLRLSDTAPKVKALVGDADPQIRRTGIIAMGLWPHQYSSDLIGIALNEREDTENRLAAITSLDGIPPQQTPEGAVQQLGKLLNTKLEIGLQVATVQYLADVNNADAKLLLTQFATRNDIDPVVQDILRDVLGSPQ